MSCRLPLSKSAPESCLRLDKASVGLEKGGFAHSEGCNALNLMVLGSQYYNCCFVVICSQSSSVVDLS